MEIDKFKMIANSANSSCTEELFIHQQQQFLELMDIASEIESNGGFRAGNFFTVNRATMTSFIGTILTYLIILMTWPGPEDDYIPEYLKGVCCFAYNEISQDTGIIVNKVKTFNTNIRKE